MLADSSTFTVPLKLRFSLPNGGELRRSNNDGDFERRAILVSEVHCHLIVVREGFVMRLRTWL